MELIRPPEMTEFLENILTVIHSSDSRCAAVSLKLKKLPGFLVAGQTGNQYFVSGFQISTKTSGLIEGIGLFLKRVYCVLWGNKVFFYRDNPFEDAKEALKKEYNAYLVHSVHEE